MTQKEDHIELTKDDKMVLEAYQRLLDSYSASKHRKKFDVIEKAFHFAETAHKGVKRASGVPYIMHPLAVALIASEEMGLGSTSIAAALLHDVVEDTDYTVEDLENVFGEKIAKIVDGLTKISGGIFEQAISKQAENMRKLLLTMSEDIRVVLLKIADRLHNMRTLDSLLPVKQYRIAGETMYLYAPLAHRLGLFAIKTELEDLSFKYEYPEEYRMINYKLEETLPNREVLYNNFAKPIEEKLKEVGVNFKMQARLKSVFSISKKMKAKSVSFEDIYDLFAVRIVFEPNPEEDEKNQCWDIYSIITDIYRPRPDRLRDWISRPKANGYQALHLTVMGPDGEWIEVQIRTTKMDDIAEKGLAAHWKYKESRFDKESNEQTELDHWLEKIHDALEESSPNAMDFLDTIKMNLYSSEIFIFTPKGDARTLPQHATALDFAYDIHSNIGDQAIGAKVNHKLVPLSYRLSSGDQVEILTSKSHQPQEEWLNYVTTARAKTRVEQSLRKQRKKKTKEGETIFLENMGRLELEPTQQILDRFVTYFGYSKKEDFFYAIAAKQIELPENVKKILKDKKNPFLNYFKQAFSSGNNNKEKNIGELTELLNKEIKKIDQKKTYTLKEENVQKDYYLASCCNPVPGDDVVGFINEQNRLIIHKLSCKKAQDLGSRFGNRMVNCIWAGHINYNFPAVIEIVGNDKLGMLNEITRTITNDLSVNMRKLTFETEDGFFEGRIELLVHHVKDITTLTQQLKKIKGIQSVRRVD
jgi:(p)ppGpp synthetase, RelA/SpoT family